MLVILYETALGYALFNVHEFEEVGISTKQVEEAIEKGKKFKKAVKKRDFYSYKSAAESLQNSQALIDGEVTDLLVKFLEKNNLHTEEGVQLGVLCPTLGGNIKERTGIDVTHTGVVLTIWRGINLFLDSYLSVEERSRFTAERGLGHALSRSKVQYNANRVDNMIIQGIASNDQMDKDINMFIMRLREWYSHHFPELSVIVEDNSQYARLVALISRRQDQIEEKLEQIQEIVMDEDKVQDILSSSKVSMGSDISDNDLLNVHQFAESIVGFYDYRKSMGQYLSSAVDKVAPNTGAILGDTLTARLITKAGSLTNLAKMPSCSVQILGAEKALFRAIKTKVATPKFGLLFHASHLGKASSADKGKISRCLANKVSLASRIDCFSETLTNKIGLALNQQIVDRLNFYETGEAPPTSDEVMANATKAHLEAVEILNNVSLNGDKKEIQQNETEESDIKTPKKKKSKKDKKENREESEDEEGESLSKKRKLEEVEEDLETETPKKKSKKSKKRKSEVIEEN